MAAVKEAQGVAVGDSKNEDAVKKRGPKKASPTKTKGAAKRKRGGNDEDKSAQESEISDDGERDSKKLKAEVKEDQEQEIKHEAEEV